MRRKEFRATMERIDGAIARMDRAIERSTAAIERSDRSYQVMNNALQQFIKAEARRERESRDMRDEIRANTQAVLAMLDRLGPAPG